MPWNKTRFDVIDDERRNLVGKTVYMKDPLFWNRMEIRTDGCWVPTTKCTAHGRYKIIKRDGKYMTAHRYAFILANPKIEIIEGHEICHRCDFGLCSRPKHLFQGTRTENRIDAAKKGRLKGQRLMPKDVIEIRKMYAGGNETIRSVAAKFDLHHSNVFAIISGKKWWYV